MMWLVDPSTHEPLPAFEAAEYTVRRICGEQVWLGEHDELAPTWERSEPDECGFVYVRPCRRPCVHLPGKWSGYR